MNSDINKNDLELQAFRYVCDELPDEETHEFEEQLATDQAAREAVAHAVCVGQAVAFCGAGQTDQVAEVASAGSTKSRRPIWVVVATSVAAAFLAGVGITHWFNLNRPDDSSPGNSLVNQANGPERPETPRVEVTPAINGAALHVVALWSESAEEFGQSADELAGAAPIDEDVDAVSVVAAADAWLAEDEAEFSVPNWMLAAVSPDDDPESGDAMPEEN